MNHDHDDDIPDPTLEPSTAPATSGPGSDDEEDTTNPRTKLAPRAQKFLAEQRRDLHDRAEAERKLVMEYRRNRQQARDGIAPVQHRVLNKTHLSTWDELWLLIEGLYLQMIDYPYVFVLSGWCATAKELSGPPFSPSRRLLDMASWFGVYGRASALAAAYIADATDDNADWLWTWVRTWPDRFEAALVDGYWTAERIKQVADAEMDKRRIDLEAEFLFLEKRVFWFTPSAHDHSRGWNDFFFLTLGYHYLPDDLKNDLGPYALTIRTVPSPSPEPPTAPAVTVPAPPPRRAPTTPPPPVQYPDDDHPL